MEELKLLSMFIEPNFIKVIFVIGGVIILDYIFTNDSNLISHVSLILGYGVLAFKFLSWLVAFLKLFQLWGLCKDE